MKTNSLTVNALNAFLSSHAVSISDLAKPQFHEMSIFLLSKFNLLAKGQNI